MVLEQQKRCSKTPSICTTAPWSFGFLRCLSRKLGGVAGVQLQSHAKHALISKNKNSRIRKR
jgi:hypothetical protein